MEFIEKIIYFILVIGVLVAVHEFGHFIAARMTGMRADIFSIGMGKRLFGWNRINGFTFGNLSRDIELSGHTDYRISIFPIGGYVKIAGMIDESFDTDFAGTEPETYEFRSKNTIQKAFVLSAGVIMNVILAIVIFAGSAFFLGKFELGSTDVVKVDDNSIGRMIGIKSGDKIVSINGNEITTWNQILESLTQKEFGKQINLTVQRNGNQLNLLGDGTEIVTQLSKKVPLGLHPETSTYIGGVVTGSPADEAGIRPGDTVLMINGLIINSTGKVQQVVKSNFGKEMVFDIKRGNEILKIDVLPAKDSLIGVELGTAPFKVHKYGFFESFYIGVIDTYEAMKFILVSLRELILGNLSFRESIGGPIMIFEVTAQQAERGFADLVNLVALLSLSLAFMNILPIPALDGGHLVFVLLEGIAGKEVPTKIKLGFQQGGVIILLLFMALVIYNDILRSF
jgi:regulator of sigma E protease